MNKYFRKLFFIGFLFLLVLLIRIESVPSSPHGFTDAQPDGSETPFLYIHGDHASNYITDDKGYAVTRNATEWYVYITRNKYDKSLTPSELVVGPTNPDFHDSLMKHSMPENEISIDNLDFFETSESTSFLRKGRKRSSHKINRKLIDEFEISVNNDEVKIMKNVVILMRFKDHEGRSLPTVNDVDLLMNNEGPILNTIPTGSVADVYKKNSYGKLILQSDVLEWVTINRTEAECADGVNGYSDELVHCMQEALDIHVSEGVDFSEWDVNKDSNFDGITILHSGYGAEWGSTDCFGQYWKDRIWSHKWSLPSRLHWSPKIYNNSSSMNTTTSIVFNKYHITGSLWGKCGTDIARIGSIAHELGHFLDLPDLYDSDGSGNGAGNYDLMANMWGWMSNQYFPPLMSCWTKAQLGWLEPELIESSGVYTIPAVANSPACYKITHGYPADEYLLVENRYATSFDFATPGGGGLAVWHIDENAPYNEEGHPDQEGYPMNGKHYRVSLLQADAKFGLEKKTDRGDYGDLFRASDELKTSGYLSSQSYQSGKILYTGIHITEISEVAEVMSFKISFNFTFDDSSSENVTEPVNLDCVDDPNYYFKDLSRNCEWVGLKSKCDKCLNRVCTRDHCRKTCGNCLA